MVLPIPPDDAPINEPDEIAGDGADVVQIVPPPIALTYLIAGGYTIIAILVAVGGLISVFSPELVGAVIAIYGPAMGYLAWFYYRRYPGSSDRHHPGI